MRPQQQTLQEQLSALTGAKIPVKPIEEKSYTKEVNVKKSNSNKIHRTAAEIKMYKENLKQKALAENKPVKPGDEFRADDGVTHINIDRNGKTQLGKFLQYGFKENYKHPVYGSFKSVEGFRIYLLHTKFCQENNTEAEASDIENIRTLHGKELFMFSKTLELSKKPVVHLLAAATYRKLLNNETMLNIFLSNKLPFESYFVDLKNNKKIQTYGMDQYIEYLNAMKKSILAIEIPVFELPPFKKRSQFNATDNTARKSQNKLTEKLATA